MHCDENGKGAKFSRQTSTRTEGYEIRGETTGIKPHVTGRQKGSGGDIRTIFFSVRKFRQMKCIRSDVVEADSIHSFKSRYDKIPIGSGT